MTHGNHSGKVDHIMSKIVGIAGQLHDAAQNLASNISDRSITPEDLSEVLEHIAATNSVLGGIATRLKTRFDYRTDDTTLPWDVRELYGDGIPQQQNLATIHYELCGDWRQTAELLAKIHAAQRGDTTAKHRITPDEANQAAIAAHSLADFANLPTGQDGSLTLQALANAFINLAVLGRRLNHECCARAENATTSSAGDTPYATLASLFNTLVRHSEAVNRDLLTACDAYQTNAKETSSSSVAGQASRFDQAVYDLTTGASLPRLREFPDVMANLANAMAAISGVGAKWRRACQTTAETNRTVPAVHARYERLAQTFTDLDRRARQIRQLFTQAEETAEHLRKQARPATV